MASPEPNIAWQPVTNRERYAALDVLRGLALFGVLMVNLETCFRVPLAEYILSSHHYSAWPDYVVYLLISGVLQFKAFTLFSLSFGIGVAVQAERAAPRGISFFGFFVRRQIVLLGLGLCHIFLIWNGDILVLYAVCGLLISPLIRLPPIVLALAGVVAIILNFVLPVGMFLPNEDFYVAHAARETRAYAEGGYWEIMLFRWWETIVFIAPLLVSVLPKTLGLMLLGVAAWRSGLLREPERFRRSLWVCALVGGTIGGAGTLGLLFWPSSLSMTGIPTEVLQAGSYIPLAVAYAAVVFLWLGAHRSAAFGAPLAAVGQMALTNYLTQSVVLGFIFYGYGFGLLGQLGPAVASLIGISLYAAQVIFSLAWLRRYQFGPVEWLWRCLTYGQVQPIRRPPA